jgi:hypothetical protein
VLVQQGAEGVAVAALGARRLLLGRLALLAQQAQRRKAVARADLGQQLLGLALGPPAPATSLI